MDNMVLVSLPKSQSNPDLEQQYQDTRILKDKAQVILDQESPPQ
jgi:hypothetical protein